MAWNSFLNAFANDLAVDLGTSSTLVYSKTKGIVVCEPSIVAVDQVTGQVEAFGAEAKEMLGRSPGRIIAIKPMRHGVIADFEHTEKMLDHFIRKAHGRGLGARPRLVMGVPSQITQVEKRAVRDSAYRAKVAEVYLVEQVLAAALGVDMPITEPSGNMIIDIGGGTTEVAVISMAGIVYSRTMKIAGDEMDEAIIQFIKRKHSLLIGERTAEEAKIRIGSAGPVEESPSMEIKGRDLIAGIPKKITITGDEIREALEESVGAIIDATRAGLEQIPPELSADIVDNGIVLSGGGALLRGLDRRLSDETKLPVLRAQDPLTAVAVGSGKMLSDLRLLRKVAID